MNGSRKDAENPSGSGFGDLIRRYRRQRGLSQEQLGAIVQVKKNAVGAWEAGRSRPDLASVPILCRELGIPLHEFFGIADSSDGFRLKERFERLNSYNRQVILHQMDMLYDLQAGETRQMPKLVRLYQNDLAAAAGPVSYLPDDSGEMIWVLANEKTGRADEVIRVSGDSMEPTFSSGDRVLVQHCDHVQEGEIGIFVNGDAGYIKEYRRDGLYSLNPAYAPIRFSENDSVRCVGRVLGVLSEEMLPTEAEIKEYRNGNGKTLR